MEYIPISPSQQQDMLTDIGLNSMEALFADIPSALRAHTLQLPEAFSEMALSQHMQQLAGENQTGTLFLGAGAYDHFIPAAVDMLASRQEFYTAYTPYQPEISQGTLTAIFEFQTYICRLTGLDVSNASLYDGASALWEAVSMACTHTGRTTVLLPDNIHPAWRETVRTHAHFAGIAIKEIACPQGILPEIALDDSVAAVVAAYPNFYGIVEDVNPLMAQARTQGAVAIAVCNPIMLGLLPPPDCDICVGDGQPLGNPLGYGGPYLGFMAAKEAFLRRMPGRIVGQTTDKNGKRGYVLTMQTREQHIRREKATSNICSNQALCALRASIYLALMGPSLADVAELCAQKARYTYEQLLSTKMFTKVYKAPFFNEFVLRFSGDAYELNRYLAGQGIVGGLPLDQHNMLFCVTEKRTQAEIDTLVRKAGAV